MVKLALAFIIGLGLLGARLSQIIYSKVRVKVVHYVEFSQENDLSPPPFLYSLKLIVASDKKNLPTS